MYINSINDITTTIFLKKLCQNQGHPQGLSNDKKGLKSWELMYFVEYFVDYSIIIGVLYNICDNKLKKNPTNI